MLVKAGPLDQLDVLNKLYAEEYRLWVGYNPEIHCAMLTRTFIDHDNNDTHTCDIHSIGGERLRDCFGHFGRFVDWLRDNDVKCIDTKTRKGVARILKTLGFKYVGEANDKKHIRYEITREEDEQSYSSR
jgi:hypothetical protein